MVGTEELRAVFGRERRVQRQVDDLWRAAEILLLDERIQRQATMEQPQHALHQLQHFAVEQPELGLLPRLTELQAALAQPLRRTAYVEQYGVAGVRLFPTCAGARVYLLPVETFPQHVNNLYLVCAPHHTLLFDTGSGTERSRHDIDLALAIVRTVYGEAVTLERLDTIVISHSHIDHVGGMSDLRARTHAEIALHERDARLVAQYTERTQLLANSCACFLHRAGVPEREQQVLLDLYQLGPRLFSNTRADRALADDDRVCGYRVIHTPGHAAGLICLEVDDLLLTSDHVLARTTPHQTPPSMVRFGGLDLYLASLAKLRRQPAPRLALGGHEEPILDLHARIDALVAFHEARLHQTRELCAAPQTIFEISQALFGPRRPGPALLLAVEEAGAHVEHLHELGQLTVANHTAAHVPTVALQYRSS